MSETGGPVTGPRRVPPPWFFAVVGIGVVIALVVIFMGTRQPPPPAPVSPWPLAGDLPAATSSGSSVTDTGSSPAASMLLGASCTSEVFDYGIDYPTGWNTRGMEGSPGDCSYFDPEPIARSTGSDEMPSAVMVAEFPARLSQAELALVEAGGAEVLSRESGTYSDADRPGVAMEVLAESGSGVWPKGVQAYLILVDREESTIMLLTTDAKGDYEQDKQIVDAMAQSLRIAG